MSFDSAPEGTVEYFLGTDRQYDFVIYTSEDQTECRDVTGYETTLMVKRRVYDDDVDALIDVNGVVSGVFNADPAVNTQKISVTVTKDMTDDGIDPSLAHWAIKRTNSGAGTVLRFGIWHFKQSAVLA